MSSNVPAEGSDSPPPGPVPTSLRAQPESGEAVAFGCLLLGWFVLNTLVTAVGDFHQSFRFYNVWAILLQPAHMATGLTESDRTLSLAFGVICLAAALAVFVPFRLGTRISWLVYLAPLALMVVCAAVLYSESSSDYLADNGQLGTQGTRLIQFANSLLNRASVSVTRHISIGLGAYLSFAASVYLAWRGWSRFRSA